jgi:cytochrome c peroxidase
MKLTWLFILFMVILIAACNKDSEIIENDFTLIHYPLGFPKMDFPEDNVPSQERWELGKKLFFETHLSDDNEVSCASCHLPSHAFSDVVALSPGSEGAPGLRNAPSLANVGYHPYFTREGGIPTLEMQILVPIQEHNEFNSNIVDLAEELKEVDNYNALAQQAYGQEMSPFVITRALATFERSLVSGEAMFDLFSEGIINALDGSQINGMDLFFSSKANCSTCHGGFNFTKYEILNNGLYTEYEDPGLFRLTGDPLDSGKFKVPSLRNIALTGPYMHDGSLESLAAVVDHYNQGGNAHPNQDNRIIPLGLTSQEKQDLVHFLEALSDYAFIENERFQNP